MLYVNYTSIELKKRKQKEVSNQQPTLQLKELKLNEKTKAKDSRRKEMVNRAEISEIEKRKTIEKINETKSWFFEKINKIDRPLTRLRRKERRSKLLKSEMKMGTVPDSMEIKRTIGEYLEKAMAPHSSTLAWKIPWTEEPGGLQSMRSLRVGHD